jgi:hypothetical protein
MRPITLHNDSILKVLNKIVDSVYDPDTLAELVSSDKVIDSKCPLISDLDGYSDEYFYRAKNDFNVKEFGFPTCSRMLETNGSLKLTELLKKHTRRLQRKLGGEAGALTALYPENGYIGWHHNGNAPGYNILFSYSTDGKGKFQYYDYETESIIPLYDSPGWNVKVGYYPDQNKEPERVYWHEADTVNPRLSIAFIVDDRALWKNMIFDITGGDYDAEYIENQGPTSIVNGS